MLNESGLVNECFYREVILDESAYVFGFGVVVTVFNAVFSPVAVLGNFAIIAAIFRTPDLHNSSNFLIACLAVSDFFVGLLCQPLVVISKIAEFKRRFDLFCIAIVSADATAWTASTVSCITLCMIAIERYLALHFHLRYHELVSIKKLANPIIFSWLFCALLSVSRFFAANISRYISLPLLIVLLVLTFGSYAKIHKIVKRHRNQIQSQERSSFHLQNQTAQQVGEQFQLARYRKSTNTMLMVLGLFSVAYVPMLFVQVALNVAGLTNATKIALELSSTVIFMVASLNPIVYCLKIKSLRHECLKLVPFWKRQ